MTAAVSEGHRQTARTVSVLLALALIPFGILMLIGHGPTHAWLTGWGVAGWFVHAVGALQVLAGLGLLAPRVASYAAALVATLTLYALVATLANGAAAVALVPLAVGAGSLYVLWARLPEAAGTDVTPIKAGP